MIKALIFILSIIVPLSTAEALSIIEPDARVAVMDFGTHEGTSDPDIDLVNAEHTTSEYVIARLNECTKFVVIDKDFAAHIFSEENLNTIGLIDPLTARRIGEILNVRYIIYGNVISVGLAENDNGFGDININSKEVKAGLSVRIMDVETGRILMAVKGEGKSKIASVGLVEDFFLIGNVKVGQTSVHNALQKAAFNAVDLLVQRLYGR